MKKSHHLTIVIVLALGMFLPDTVQATGKLSKSYRLKASHRLRLCSLSRLMPYDTKCSCPKGTRLKKYGKWMKQCTHTRLLLNNDVKGVQMVDTLLSQTFEKRGICLMGALLPYSPQCFCPKGTIMMKVGSLFKKCIIP